MARTLSRKRVACLGVCACTGAGPDRLGMVGFKLYFCLEVQYLFFHLGASYREG